MKLINISKQGKSTNVLMKTKAPTITRRAFQENQAIQKQVALYHTAIDCINSWAKWYLSVNTVFTLVNSAEAPQTLDEMKAQMEEYGNIYIYSGDSESCDWSVDANVALRHLHDLQHVQYDRGTNPEDELFLSEVLADAVVSSLGAAIPSINSLLPSKSEQIKQVIHHIIHLDFAAQTRYYQKHKRFVSNQGLFLRTVFFNDESVFNNYQV